VLIGGEPVVRDRQLVRLDSAELTAEARQAAKLLWERIEAIGPHPFSPSLLLASAGGG
jgi:hypothetical protein